MLDFNTLDEGTKEVVYWSYALGYGAYIAPADAKHVKVTFLNKDRSTNKRVAVIAEIWGVKELFRNGYLCLLNADITKSDRLVITEKRDVNAKYKYDLNDTTKLDEFRSQHPKVKAAIQEMNDRLEAEWEEYRKHKEWQRQQEEEEKRKEEEFLKTPKGRMITFGRNAKELALNGLVGFTGIINDLVNSAEETSYENAKMRHDGNHYITPKQNIFQRANDEYIIRNHKK